MRRRLWAERLQDARSGEVVFLSHCLLNQHTRYPGGASYAGAVPGIVQECLARGWGIVQLPCPESAAWGGVRKRRLLAFFGARGTWRARSLRVLVPLAMAYTRWVYRRLARRAAREVAEYAAAGYTVRGIVAVEGSPSCGLQQTLALAPTLTRLVHLQPSTASAAEVRRVVEAGEIAGSGAFTLALQRALERRALTVPWRAERLPSPQEL